MKKNSLKKGGPELKQMKISFFCVKTKPDERIVPEKDDTCVIVDEIRSHKNQTKQSKLNEAKKRKSSPGGSKEDEIVLPRRSPRKRPVVHNKTAESPDLFATPEPNAAKKAKKTKLEFDKEVPRTKPCEPPDEVLLDMLEIIEDRHQSTLLKSLENKETKNIPPQNKDNYSDADSSSFIENTPPLTQPSSPLLKPSKIRLKNKKRIFKAKLEEEFVSNDSSLEIKEDCVKCNVVGIDREPKKWELKLTLLTVEKRTSVSCLLRDVWASIDVQLFDIVTVKAKRIEEVWIVDNNYGFVCLYPDDLVSSTALVGAMFCRRRGVLSDLFKGLESDNRQMVLGKLIHEILQKCLKTKRYLLEDIEGVVKESLEAFGTVRGLYSCGMSVEEAKLSLGSYTDKIRDFISDYVTVETTNQNGGFQGQITDVVDIEESVWAPKLGVKGRIDVTVKVRSENRNRTIPLELKTGRASFSNEHKGQIALYTMMMSELGENVDSGLLLYLKEGITKEIRPSHQEKRDLVLLRNDLVRYLTRRGLSDQTFGTPYLPEPISFRRGCERCPYLTTCSTFLRTSDNLSSTHPMKDLSVSATQHLTEDDIKYFLHWCGLIYLEENEEKNELRNIWSMPQEERELSGKCICQTKIEKVEDLNEEFLHTFVKNNFQPNSKICPGDYVIVSTNQRYNISSGRVVNILPDKCVVLLDRNLSHRYPDQTFSIDIYPSKYLLTNYLSNLGYFIENIEKSNRLRNIIVKKLEPLFDKKLQKCILKDGVDILASLNEQQQRAVLKAIAANDYLLIKGMPGCGKTQTIVVLVKLLVRLQKSVLITSHTNSAVDNVLVRLDKEGVPFLRLGALNRIHKSVQHRSETKLIKDCKTPNELKELYEKFFVVGATCLGSNHDLFTKRTFDYCLVDESTQVLQPEILQPLFSCRKFVLIGDPKQLPPVVKSKKAKSLGMDESLFARLENEMSTVSLSIQYRMNRVVADLANKLTYDNQLRCASEKVANAVVEVRNVFREKWLSEALSTDIERSVVFLDTSEVEYGGTDPCSNKLEVAIVKKIVTSLKESQYCMKNIGVIAPYRDQVDLLNQTLNQTVEVNTVDQYQGRDKEIIIYSCTKSHVSSKGVEEHEILNDKKRLTVAITRAKHKLILIGDKMTLVGYSPFAQLFEVLSKDQTVILSDKKCEFFLDSVLESVSYIL